MQHRSDDVDGPMGRRTPSRRKYSFFTRSNDGVRVDNVLLKVLNRQHTGYLSTGLNKRSHRKAFREVPEHLHFCLKDIVPYCFLQGHVFMGLTSCGQFLLSYKYNCDYDDAMAANFNYAAHYRYDLYFWIYRPHCLLSKYFQVCLFDDHGVDDIKTVSITQWKTDSQLLLVHGASEVSDMDAYITVVRVPKLGCLECRKLRDALDEGDRQDILCIGCNMTIHTKYRHSDSGPKFNPQFNLNCPGYIIMSENSFIHTLHIELDTKRYRDGKLPTVALSSKYLGNRLVGLEELDVPEEKPTAPVLPVAPVKPIEIAPRREVETVPDRKLSIAEEIIADFAEYETEFSESRCSVRSYPENFDELIITSPSTSAEPSTNVRLMNHRNNTNIELRLSAVVAATVTTSTVKSYVTRVDLQASEPSCSRTSATTASTSAASTSASMTSASATGAGAPHGLRRRSALYARATESYVPSQQQCGSNSNNGNNISLSSSSNSSANASTIGATLVTGDASSHDPDPAAKAYEFSEDNERCEKISAFRKRRLADKKYEFSEDNTSEENIEPFNRLRSQIRRGTTPAFNPSPLQHTGYDIPTGHHLHRASPNHGFRSPCGSPVGNRYLRSPPGIRSPSYYRHRSPSAGTAQQQFMKNIQVLSPSTGGEPFDIPKFFLDAIQKFNEKKLNDSAGLASLATGDNIENNINCDNQLPVKRAAGGSTQQPVKPEKPTCSKKLVKVFVEEDDANSVVTTEEDDCISPGYHASLPMEVHGSCYSNMQLISQASYNKLHCPAVIVTQNSFDMETFSFHVANYICSRHSKKYGILFDSAYELTHVCPLTETITCTMVLQFTASDTNKVKHCQNCSNTIDCHTHRQIYQCRSLFTWHMTSGECEVLDYGNLVGGPYLETKKLASNYGKLLAKLRKFTRKLFNSTEPEACRTYAYLRHLRILDSNLVRSKQRMTDLDNMIEFYKRHRGSSSANGGGILSDSDSDSDDDYDEDDNESVSSSVDSSSNTLVGDTSLTSDTVSDEDDL